MHPWLAPFCDVQGPQTERTFVVSLRVRDDFGQEDTDTTTALITCPY